MNKTFFLLMAAAALISCGSNDAKDNTADSAADTTQTAQASAADIANHPDYKKGFELVGKSDCFGCHSVSSKINGPSYQEVADRYAGRPGIVDTLANKIIAGGSGNWGEVAMTPHPSLSKEDAEAMVKYILLLKQQP